MMTRDAGVRRFFPILVVFALMTALTASAALADYSAPGYEFKYRNPAAFPDTCDIHGQAEWSFGGLGNWVTGTTEEQSDCARIQVKLWYQKTNGTWAWKTLGYSYTSYLHTGTVSALALDWSDHNGDNNGSGTAYGFRIQFP